ncbi:hypothetical protein DFJ74DRAFT_646851 [Hyaloraphidium curvatum]|nr:hypothetical protein DFJ74DRAFT_646851 [Hyaloraphidium curvatum]
MPRALLSAAFALAFAAAAFAAPIARQQAPLRSQGTFGLSALACGNAAPRLECPAAATVAVSAAFFGRDLPAIDGLPETCPVLGNGADDECGYSPAIRAALAAHVARLCDGQQSCVPAVDAVALFGDSCPDTSKFWRVEYDCRIDGWLGTQSAAMQSDPDPLSIRRPSLLAASKCPKLAAGVLAATETAAIVPDITDVRLALAFVDLDMSHLADFVRGAAKGVELSQITELNLTAVNVVFPRDTTVSIGKDTAGYTKVRIEAINVVSDNGTLEVWSHGPNAEGAYGPDVHIRAAKVFGSLGVSHNGLPAYHPVAAKKDITVNGKLLSLSMPALRPQTGDNAIDMCANTGLFDTLAALSVPNCSTVNETTYAPLCFRSGSCNQWDDPTRTCINATVELTMQDYGGAAFSVPSQGGGPWLALGVDRFTWPAFSGTWNGLNASSRTTTYGRTTSQIGAFHALDGSPAGTVADRARRIGLFSTSDYTVELAQHPAADYLALQDARRAPKPDLSYLGLLSFSAKHATSSPAAPLDADASGLYDGICHVRSRTPVRLPQGTIALDSAVASPFDSDPLVMRMAAGCASEMAGFARTEATAFILDIFSSFPGDEGTASSPALGARSTATPDAGSTAARGALLALSRDLAVSRARNVRRVPYLSVETITAQAELQLVALETVEDLIRAAVAKGLSHEAAAAALEGGLAAMDAEIAAAQAELRGALSHAEGLAAAASRLNATYVERIAGVEVEREAMARQIREKIGEQIAMTVVSFFTDAVAMIAGGVYGGSGMKNLLKDVAKLKDVTSNLDKMSKIFETIQKTVKGVSDFLKGTYPLVTAARLNPKKPQIAFPGVDTADPNALADLTVSALAFKDLSAQAHLSLLPAIQQGISTAADFAIALAETANAGGDMIAANIALLGANNDVVSAAARLQAAQAARDRVAAARAGVEDRLVDVNRAILELGLDSVDAKVRAMQLVTEACLAFEYAFTAPCPAKVKGEMPDPSSPAATFKIAALEALQGLDQASLQSQCICNGSFVVTDPAFIGNLSSTGSAVLDLTDPTLPALANIFGPYENLHLFQLVLKPYGITFNGTAVPGTTPVLHLDVAPSGEYLNIFTDGNGQPWLAAFLATPYRWGISLQPSASWKVVVPGSLADKDAAKFYVPTPLARFTVRESAYSVPGWDWRGVWGVQVEMWAYGRLRPAYRSAVAASSGMCSTCSSVAGSWPL